MISKSGLKFVEVLYSSVKVSYFCCILINKQTEFWSLLYRGFRKLKPNFSAPSPKKTLIKTFSNFKNSNFPHWSITRNYGMRQHYLKYSPWAKSFEIGSSKSSALWILYHIAAVLGRLLSTSYSSWVFRLIVWWVLQRKAGDKERRMQRVSLKIIWVVPLEIIWKNFSNPGLIKEKSRLQRIVLCSTCHKDFNILKKSFTKKKLFHLLMI